MRTLPEHTIPFSSAKGKLIFKEALMADTLANYFKLAEQFTTQSDPAYCGPASLTMVLNSLQIDPNKTWKGIWRWYSEEVLHCTSHEAMEHGMSIEQLTQLARCNGLHTMTLRPNDDPLEQTPISSAVIEHSHSERLYTTESCCNKSRLTSAESSPSQLSEPESPQLEDSETAFNKNLTQHNTNASYVHSFNRDLFRTAILATSQIESFHIICNLGRQELSQTGTGHFTPIGGYNATARKVLLLDTARFKYPPHWVDIDLLYHSVCSTVADDGGARGFMLLTRKPTHKERASLPPSQVRQPTLPTLDLGKAFNAYTTSTGAPKNLESMLTFLGNDDKARILLFIYLFQVNDWYGTDGGSRTDQEEIVAKGYLSHCDTFRQQIQQFFRDETPLFNQLTECLEEQVMPAKAFVPVIDLFKRMVPNHQTELLCVVLLALPPNLVAQLSQSEQSPQEARLWQNITAVRNAGQLSAAVTLELDLLVDAFQPENFQQMSYD